MLDDDKQWNIGLIISFGVSIMRKTVNNGNIWIGSKTLHVFKLPTLILTIAKLTHHYVFVYVSLTGVQVLLREYDFESRKYSTFTEDDIMNLFPVVKHTNPKVLLIFG